MRCRDTYEAQTGFGRMELYSWAVFAHIAGVFGFLLSHGASAGVALRLRREDDARAVRALLALSGGTRRLMYGSLALLGAAGIWAGVLGGWWGTGWIWASIGVLMAMTLAVVVVGTPYFRRLRKVVDVAIAAGGASGGEGDELRAMLRSARPLVVSAVGLGGLVVILWLMVLKPF